jgi:hypothetical protein
MLPPPLGILVFVHLILPPAPTAAESGILTSMNKQKVDTMDS